jgi:hypothetical protein
MNASRTRDIRIANLHTTTRKGAMSLGDYYRNIIAQVKREIEQNRDEYLLTVDSEELVEYYAQKHCLPLIEKDENRKITLEKGKSRYGRAPLRVYYPITPKKNLNIVVKRYASTRFMSGFSFQLQENWLVFPTEMRNELSLKTQIENLEKVIEWKNNDVRGGNESIRREIKTYIENRQKALKKEYEQLESIIEKIDVPLEVKREEPLPVVDFGVKEELKPLIKPEPKKPRDFFLDRNKVATLIGFIRNSCLSFEKTPKVYSKHKEEELRDIILGNLNAIFEGEVTAETFSKLGKTDIYLRIAEGNILIIECKNWEGKKKYVKGINQLFNYLTWRQNYGIIIAFVKRRDFTHTIKKAKEATQEHKTFISGSMTKRDGSEFITEHRFPDDMEKKVEIHHLLFNLFVG